MNQEAKKVFEEALNYLARSRSHWEVFNDFLDFTLLMFKWWHRNPGQFQPLEQKYPDPKEHQLFAKAYTAMAAIAENGGVGFYDPFGDYFMEHFSNDHRGQFFTPDDMCDMLVKAAIGDTLPDGARICDPCCGSGRMLLAAARISRKAHFYGSDVDITCCKMAVINFLLNTMVGEVAWMNTLTMEHWKSWHMRRVMDGNGRYIPYYIETGPNETDFIQRLQNTLPKQPTTERMTAGKPHANKKGQILLFE